MKKIIALALTVFTLSFTTSTTKTMHSFKSTTIDGTAFDFASLKGKKIMVVNTASECGYTPQYKELETLYKKYEAKNFVIVGFPCNDFGGQEPGSASDIKAFCTKNYGVTFLMMEKVSIKTSEIYQWLTSKKQNGVLDATVKWNFNKFLINEKGEMVKYLPSSVNPLDAEITKWIEAK